MVLAFRVYTVSHSHTPIPDISDAKNLMPMYQKLHTSIRKFDNDHIVLFEPTVIITSVSNLAPPSLPPPSPLPLSLFIDDIGLSSLFCVRTTLSFIVPAALELLLQWTNRGTWGASIQ